jgi:hypothetical protein
MIRNRPSRRGTMEPTLHNILKASTAAREHAQRLVEYFPEHSGALNRFEEKVRQGQKELIPRIRPEIYGKAEEPG